MSPRLKLSRMVTGHMKVTRTTPGKRLIDGTGNRCSVQYFFICETHKVRGTLQADLRCIIEIWPRANEGNRRLFLNVALPVLGCKRVDLC